MLHLAEDRLELKEKKGGGATKPRCSAIRCDGMVSVKSLMQDKTDTHIANIRLSLSRRRGACQG